MSETKFKIVDLFCGMGNFRAGFELAGAECVYSVEFDKYKRQIYKVIYGEEPNANDIRNVEAGDIPYADCWCFGAPCQDFSMAGERAGLDGSRSSLVREVFRLLGEKEPGDRPEWLVYENVRGMLSSNKGWDFAAILTEFYRGGYDTEWGILNSKFFGVPQNRGRVYVIGHIRGKSGRKIFPLGDSDSMVGVATGYEDRRIETAHTHTHTHTHTLTEMQNQVSNTLAGKSIVRQSIGVYPMGDKIIRCNGYHKKGK